MLSQIPVLIKRYSFLLSQLIKRDFKKKYRRSVLGVLWSLLNPLLTMAVQFFVFQRIFRFNVENYAVYLLTGIVLFSYMSDTTQQAMGNIVENASLINKVYVPKYIYPISRVLSSTVNFFFSAIALYLMIIFSGVAITWHHIALLYMFVTLLGFITGMSLLLCTMMVFFRDTQFLYTVFVTLWTYGTPIFYPESILSETLMKIMSFNPMYHFLKFARTVILEHQIPSTQTWLMCAGFAVLFLFIGMAVFRKHQNKFILYV